jgi:para-nitrobenzyl esterase
VISGDPLTLTQAVSRGKTLAARWKVPRDASLRDLRAVSEAAILAADPNFLETLPPYLGIVVDGYVVPQQPASVFATRQEHAVPLLLGNNARERIPGTTAPVDLKKAIDSAYGPLATQAQVLYVGEADPLYGTPADQWATDASFRCSAVAQLVWHAAAGHVAFAYEFARVPPGREALGATHTSELPYVFGTLDRPGVFGRVEAQPDKIDAQISEMMQQYWTNFAKNGDPNASTLPAWPKFDVRSRAYVQFTDAGPIAKEGLRRRYCDLFIENVKRLATP